MIRAFKQWRAKRRLQRIRDAKLASFEHRLFVKNRNAQLRRLGRA